MRVQLHEVFRVTADTVAQVCDENDSVRLEAWLGDARLKLAFSELLLSNPLAQAIGELSQQRALLEQNSMMAVWLLEATDLETQLRGARERSDHSLGTIFEALYERSPPEGQKKALQAYVSFVRENIDPHFVVHSMVTLFERSSVHSDRHQVQESTKWQWLSETGGCGGGGEGAAQALFKVNRPCGDGPAVAASSSRTDGAKAAAAKTVGKTSHTAFPGLSSHHREEHYQGAGRLSGTVVSEAFGGRSGDVRVQGVQADVRATLVAMVKTRRAAVSVQAVARGFLQRKCTAGRARPMGGHLVARAVQQEKLLRQTEAHLTVGNDCGEGHDWPDLAEAFRCNNTTVQGQFCERTWHGLQCKQCGALRVRRKTSLRASRFHLLGLHECPGAQPESWLASYEKQLGELRLRNGGSLVLGASSDRKYIDEDELRSYGFSIPRPPSGGVVAY